MKIKLNRRVSYRDEDGQLVTLEEGVETSRFSDEKSQGMIERGAASACDTSNDVEADENDVKTKENEKSNDKPSKGKKGKSK